MLDNGVLEEALIKKNKEIDRLTRELNETKQSYESKVKNLMTSVNSLKSQTKQLEEQSKDNIRVNIINTLKLERKDQETVINLLRKYIGNDEQVDQFLMKEFSKGKIPS